jgi:hypothetical protein
MKISKVIFIATAAILISQYAHAGTQGHYYPGVMGMRDVILPPKGLYALYYDPIYYSNDSMNAHGNKVGSYSTSASETKYINAYGHEIPVKLSVGLTADINASMMFTTEQLLMVWSTGWKLLGADFGMLIAPSLGYVSIEAEAKAHATGTITIGDYSRTVTKGETVKVKSDIYGFGDLLVQPVMLDWRGKHYDVGLYYGFWAPTGAYSENRIANIGMGFWSQQFQAFGAYYFNDLRTTALIVTGTYNLNSKKYDQDVTPGQSMTIEYSLSHYLTDRVEIGLCGYNQWQISADSGSAAKNKDVFYQINGIGGQIGGWVIKDKLSITTKCFYEYYGVDRFKGVLATANLIWIF